VFISDLEALLAGILTEMRRDAQAHQAEARTSVIRQPDAMRPASACEQTLARVHEYWANRLEAIVAEARSKSS
jgi:hypothetical protein